MQQQVGSDVQLVREKIEQEIQAMHIGLHGFAAGVTRHQFIEARSHRLDQLNNELATHVGETQAIQFSCQTYIQVVEGR